MLLQQQVKESLWRWKDSMEDHSGLDRKASMLVAFVFLSTALLYARTLGHGFVNLDDDAYVYENVALAGGLSWDSLRWSFTAFHSANWHPLTWISHAIDISLFGFNPAGHHLVNVLLHSLNAVLVFLLVRAMTHQIWGAWAIALLFAWHPLHVESVAWIAERKDLLSVFFALLCLLAWARYARTRHVAFYILSLTLFAASLMAKPMMVTLPCVLLLLDLWPLNRLGAGPRHWLVRVAEKLPFAALVGVSIALTLAAQQEAMTSLAARPLELRLANAVVSYGAYLYQTFVPWPLAIPYPFAPEKLSLVPVAGSLLVLALITLWALWRWRAGQPYAIVGWLWFLGTLAPVIGILQVGEQAHADRYTYFPHIGLFLVILLGMGELTRKWPPFQLPCRLLLTGFLLLCLPLSYIQIGKWKDSETLFRHSLAVTEGNFVAHNNLGKALMEQGDFEEAREHFAASVALSPTNLDAQNNLAVAHLAANELQEALDTFALLVHHLPDDPEIRVNYGAALLAAGYPERARVQANAALAQRPGFSNALQLLDLVDMVLQGESP